MNPETKNCQNCKKDFVYDDKVIFPVYCPECNMSDKWEASIYCKDCYQREVY